MGETTKIEWCDATFNPWWGCTNVSPACDHCYAETLSKRYGHDVWGKTGGRRFFGDKHWNDPVRWNRKAEQAGVPLRVFCASMADVFDEHPSLVTERERLWDLIGRTPWIVWLLLTKRPQHAPAMAPWKTAGDWPANVWIGTTIENQRYANLRIPQLLRVPAPIRFLSCEPLLGSIDLTEAGWIRDRQPPGVDLVITGGESGPGARPTHPDWFRGLRDQTNTVGMAFHFKQWGDWAPGWTTGRRLALIDAAGAEHTTNDLSHFHVPEGWARMSRLGKRDAGRLLDGRTWDEYPPLPLPVRP